MDYLLPDYVTWRKKYNRAFVVSYFITVILECVIYFLLKSNDMILQSTEVYIRQYFIRPIFWNSVIAAFSFIITKAVKAEKIKNAVPVIALTCMIGNIAYVHNVFMITMLLFCIPILMTIVFGHKTLLYEVNVISCLFIAYIIWDCYRYNTTTWRNPYFIPSALIAVVGIFVCSGIACTLIDLLNTQNKKLQNVAEEAVRANNYKSTFLSNMSHEIRTPMNAIVGITDIMLREKRSELDEKYLKNIKRSGSALLNIINDILDFSKIESGKMELVDEKYSLYEILDDLSLIFWNRIGEKNIELIYDIDPYLPEELIGDEVRVKQIIINLMNNAIKFTEEGFVKLGIKIKEKSDAKIMLDISVEDSGQGIRKEDFSKLFVSFEQLDSKKNYKKEGTGLGLAISKKLINMMGGDIHVESEYGRGTKFSFSIEQKMENAKVLDYSDVKEKLKNKEISLAFQNESLKKSVYDTLLFYDANIIEANNGKTLFTDQSTAIDDKNIEQYILTNPYKAELTNNKQAFHKPFYIYSVYLKFRNKKMSDESIQPITPKFSDARVLIAEDNEINLMIELELFSIYGMQIDTAVNGQEALEKVKTNHYDLVFMDHMMPVMDGVEATKAIRSLNEAYYQELPIIALTADVIEESKREFFRVGMNDVVTKPIIMDDITAILTKFCHVD